MGYQDRIEIDSLVGETLDYIDTDGGSQIILTTKSGRKVMIHHDQDCCEYVRIQNTEGDWHKLAGKVLVEATHETYIPVPKCECSDSCTHTALTFKTDSDTVISRWVGESNGYYSESVDLEEITNQRPN